MKFMKDFEDLAHRALEYFPEPLFILDAQLDCVFWNGAFECLAALDRESAATIPAAAFWPAVKTDLKTPEVMAELVLESDKKELVNLAVIELPQEYWLVRIIPEPGVSRERHFHSQRLRTLGMMAGGVAHDFNNVLAGILGHITYLKTILPESGPHVESLNAIEEGGKKASTMTQQILNFSKLDTAEKLLKINLCELVMKTFGLLRGALSPEFNLEYRLPEKPVYVMGAEGRLAQVIVNLVINSRDALEHGGDIKLTVERCADPEAMHKLFPRERKPSSFSIMKVSDSGKGMTPAVLRRVFEPYFSTKSDKGTGLGLSTVQTIVKSCGGVIDIASRPNQGTTVSVYLPRVDCKEEAKPASQGRVQLPKGTERVLVVDDEDPVRNVLCVSLAHLGYDVEIACSGMEALDKMTKSEEPFDLVILDMLMPKLSGDEVFFKLKEINPNIRVLVISGYTSEESVQRILENGGKGFIQKPFTIDDLSRKVRACLDQ